MYKVAIVEDESLTRFGLRRQVAWPRFDMEVAAVLPNGPAARDYFGRAAPEVAVAVIGLPSLDGLPLIELIRSRSPDIRIVVLSSLEDFGTVRQAMALGVSDYLPVSRTTVRDVEDALLRLRERLRAAERPRPAGSSWRPVSRDMGVMKERMLKDLLFYGIVTPDEFHAFAERNGLRLSPGRLIGCAMEADGYASLKRKFQDGQGHLVQMTLLNLLDELMADSGRGEAFPIEDNLYLLLFCSDGSGDAGSEREAVAACLRRIQAAFRDCFGGTASFGISAAHAGYGELPRLFAEAREALQRKLVLGSGRLYWREDKGEDALTRERLNALKRSPGIREWLAAPKLKEYEELIAQMQRMFTGDPAPAATMKIRLAKWLSAAVLETVHRPAAVAREPLAEKLEECDTLPEMAEAACSFVREAAGRQRQNSSLSREVSRALAYIGRHYHESIGLRNVAGYAGLSPSYLSNRFRKELGITFVDYLNRCRVERAKELLAETDLKSCDIAVKVGFSPEYTYFSKVFKRIAGCNPNEFRRQRRTSGGSGPRPGCRFAGIG